METMRATSIDGECCMKNGNMEGVCQKSEAKQQGAGNDHCSKDKECSQPTPETTCICICTFQFVAPEQNLVRFHDHEFSLPHNYSATVQQIWSDPFLSAPWQPPDII